MSFANYLYYFRRVHLVRAIVDVKIDMLDCETNICDRIVTLLRKYHAQ